MPDERWGSSGDQTELPGRNPHKAERRTGVGGQLQLRSDLAWEHPYAAAMALKSKKKKKKKKKKRERKRGWQRWESKGTEPALEVY